MPENKKYSHVWARIDLETIKANIRNLKAATRPQTRFMAVVKADAYGHGAVPVARTCLMAGADALGVARLHEAEELRQAGIDAPMLVFGFTPPSQASVLADLDLTATLYSLDMARDLSDAAVRAGRTIKVHLKVDTGMGRVGLLPDTLRVPPVPRHTAISEIKAMFKLPGLEFEGLYTHFASADSKDKTYAEYQLQIFDALVADLKKEGLTFQVCHAANSAAIIDLPQSHFDMVRGGIAIYGLYPSPEVERSKVALKPAMTLYSVVTFVKEVPKGFKVSYAMTWEAPARTRIASVPVGYADGYPRALSNIGSMLVCGKRAPIVGRVCMDQTLIDVGHIPEVSRGDEVVVIGRQGDDMIPADEVADLTATINYEIVSSLTTRVHRIYAGSASAESG